MARVVIAHDDQLVREVVAGACAKRGVEIVGAAVTYRELIARSVELGPDVVLTADRLGPVPVEDALDALSATDTPVLVLSTDPSPDRLDRLLARDVRGYLSYDTAPDDVGRSSPEPVAAHNHPQAVAPAASRADRHRRPPPPDPDAPRARRMTATMDGLAA